MADMMAIVSKAVFEKAAGKSPSVGTQLRMDRYVSANKALDRLADGGKLYLVTVRPPSDALWLVGVLDKPKFDGEQWIAKASQVPITDISSLKGQLEFESGKGLKAAKGQLGMSLQAPRAMTAGDTRIIDNLVSGDESGDDADAAGTADGDDGGGFPDAPSGAVSTGTGNRRELLLAAVIADPDSEGARQVYADALVAANDPRGEFILLDMQLDGPLSIRKRAQMAERRGELLGANRKEWFPYSLRHRLNRGFIAAVTGSLKQLNGAGKLFASEPITDVELISLDAESVAKLVTASWLPRVHRLTVRGKIGDAGFATLIAAPALANLRALNVTGNKLAGDALVALRGNLPKCTKLVLSNNPLEGGLVGIAKWAHAGELETLYLGNCKLSAASLDKLFDGPVFTKLAKLSLTDNELGTGIGKLLAKHAAKLPALQHLELHNTGINTAGVKELAGAAFPTARRFDVRNNRIDAKQIKDDPRISA